jgi:hypothetical protein
MSYYKELMIGDIVRIVRGGLLYSNYESWAKRHNATGWINHAEPKFNDVFTVVAMGKHTPEYSSRNSQYDNNMLYLIEDHLHGKMLYLIEDHEGKQFIFERAGIQYIAANQYFEKEEFEI